MTIKLRLLGYYQLIIGTMIMDMILPENSSLEDLWQSLVSRCRQLESEDMKSIAGMTVNGVYINRKDWSTTVLVPNSAVDLVSQMAGG